MGFEEFHGNKEVVRRLREMMARDHFPHAVILAGPRGAGKFTLAQMLAKAMNCRAPRTTDGLPDFCGECPNCRHIAAADDLEARITEAIEARENLREADKRETRLFVQTHADVMIVPPDPPQMMIKVDQVRHVVAEIYYRPSEGRERVFLFTDSAFMKEAANSLLKVLEEPPEFATIFLLTENPGELLPTIRSRSVTFTLAPLPTSEVEEYLAQERRELAPKQRALAARLCGGAIGSARTFDLEGYMAARKDALLLLEGAVNDDDHTALFKATESYRAGAEGREKTERLIRTTYSLLEDLLALQSNAADLVRNRDIEGNLKQLAAAVEFGWIAATAQRLAEVETGMRRNLLRSLSLDAFATSLER